jgi:hypothetical protein
MMTMHIFTVLSRAFRTRAAYKARVVTELTLPERLVGRPILVEKAQAIVLEAIVRRSRYITSEQ